MNQKSERKEFFTLSPQFCMHNGAVIISQSENAIQFGLLEASDTQLRLRLFRTFSSFLRNNFKIFEADVSFTVITRSQLLRYVSYLYGKNSNSFEKRTVEDEKKNDEAAAVLLLNSILEQARSSNATDIHIENNMIRFRVNGRLFPHMVLDEKRCEELILRIKLLSGMNILEKRQSQDGHFVFEKTLFVRVSGISVVNDAENMNGHGESLVLRLLDSKRIVPDLDLLGFSLEQCAALRKIMRIPHGLVLICGATGSGKSTTAAALLCEIARFDKNNGHGRKIISIEDPVEYLLPFATQIQVDEKNQNDFSDCLRSIFRQDPDVLFIGEIRDSLTAKTAVQAALTGHLVFATLHTSGFQQTLLRLRSLGADEVLSKAVLKAVVSQCLSYDGEKTVLDAEVELFDEKLSRPVSLPLLSYKKSQKQGIV